jgi:hypothetical protein
MDVKHVVSSSAPSAHNQASLAGRRYTNLTALPRERWHLAGIGLWASLILRRRQPSTHDLEDEQ